MRPVPRNNLHVACVWSCTVRRLACSSAPPKQLSHKTVLKIREAAGAAGAVVLGEVTVVVLGKKHVPDSEFAGSLFELVDDERMALPALVAVAKLLSIDRVGRDAFFFDEFLDLLVLISGLIL